jgi:hypothetical protein
MSSTTLPWSQCLRYCSMCRGSVTAQNLYRKAKTGRRLSPAEIRMVERFAGRMKDLVGDGNVEVRVPAGALSGRVVHIPPELLLHGNRAELTLKGPWLADTVTGTVVGKYVSGPETLTLFPNSVILVTDLARLLRRFHPSPL